MVDICSLVDSKKKYFIYGTSWYGQFCCKKLMDYYGKDKVVGFLESNAEEERYVVGKPVMTPTRGIELAGNDTGIIITGRKSFETMRKNAIEAGFLDENIITPTGIIPYINLSYSEQKPVKSVCLWPPIETYNEDLIRKLSWFLPDRISISAWTTDEQTTGSFGSNVSVCDIREADKVKDEADYILLWDIKRNDNMEEKYPSKIRVIDPNFIDQFDTLNWIRLYFYSFSPEERAEFVNASKTNFIKLLEEKKRYKRANLFCTGPSISEVYSMKKGAFDQDINIICNTMVKDSQLLEELKPQVLTYSDVNFYFSPSDYGKSFYNDLRKAYEKYGFYIAVQDVTVPLLLKHCPQFSDKLIGLPYVHGDGVWMLSEERFEIKLRANIMTELMLPIATALCDEIGIAGCTGRQPDETYFWEHNGRTQYLDLLDTVKKMWPAFFRFRDYGAYYEQHCKNVDEMLEYGESIGKKYINLTTSFIPALKKRSE